VVLPLILVALAVVALAIYYWYITLPIIIIIVLIWKYKSGDSDKKEDNESRRSQSSSYQNYSQSDYSQSDYSQSDYSQSDYSYQDFSSDDYYKKKTRDYSHTNSRKKRRTQAQIKRIDERLEKFEITRREAQTIFGKRWESQMGKPDWGFYHVIQTLGIRLKYSYNDYYRKKFGYLYSKVLEIIRIVTSENNYDNYETELEISDETISKAFRTFDLPQESTADQIKSKYRELSLKYHPDKNKTRDTTAKMSEINNAYEIIMGVIA